MASAQSPHPCECQFLTTQIVNKIQQTTFSVPQSSSNDAVKQLGDILGLSNYLITNWERMNGCPQADAHLNTATFGIMIRAIDHMLDGFETAGEALKIFVSNINQINDQISHSNGDSGSPRQSSVSLGSHFLEDEEATIVCNESLRHSLMLLGEMLHDLEKDLGDADSESSHATSKKLTTVSIKLLKLLGRINSADIYK